MTSVRLLTTVGPLSPEMASAVHDLVATCTSSTGISPISEQPLLWLSDPRAHVAHIIAVRNNTLVGYGQADLSHVDEVTLELAVIDDPHTPPEEVDHVSDDIIAAGKIVAEHNNAIFSVWVHGAHSPLAHRLPHNGYQPVRTLLRKERSLASFSSPTHEDVNHFTVRTFKTNQDEDSWLAANTQAFSWHPEQGNLTRADLTARMNEPWFNPETFLVVDSIDRPHALDGFSWLKIAENTVGEIYALGVVPHVQGRGLATLLVEESLKVLQRHNCTHADLYVEADNHAANRLYDRFGFVEVERHVKFQQTQ
ncbi:mycothiol synthase [Timonella sp. A28]|uniref:mycothiol synthase n=1 Tax=Timonella sp. A28 TaxID=3442640 RepID=UPI003EB7A74C